MINYSLSKSISRLGYYLDRYRINPLLAFFVLLMITACQVDRPLPQLEIEQGGTSSLGSEMNADSTPSAGAETMLDPSGQQVINMDSMAGSESTSGSGTTSSDFNDSTTSDATTPTTDDTQDSECNTPNPALNCLDTGCDEDSECIGIRGCVKL